jgi:hypothetical protein
MMEVRHCVQNRVLASTLDEAEERIRARYDHVLRRLTIYQIHCDNHVSQTWEYYGYWQSGEDE